MKINTLWLAVIALALALAVTACGPTANQGPVGSGAGKCSSQFVQDVNTVNLSVELATKSTQGSEEIEKAQSLVTDFGAKYKGVICLAALEEQNRLDAKPTTVNADEMTQEWKDLIESGQPQDESGEDSTVSKAQPATETQVPATETQLPPEPPTEPAPTPISESLTLEIVDADLFNESRTGKLSYLQNGLLTDESNYDMTAAVCIVSNSAGDKTSFKTGEQIKFVVEIVRRDSNSDVLSATSTGEVFINLSCFKPREQAPEWNLGDIGQVFKGLANVR